MWAEGAWDSRMLIGVKVDVSWKEEAEWHFVIWQEKGFHFHRSY